MIIGPVDLGYRPSWPSPSIGQQIGNALIMGGPSIAWSQGRALEQHNASLYASAWQGLGGKQPMTPDSLRLLLYQLEELANPDIPLYVQWAATNQPFVPSRPDPHDGWYILSKVQPDYSDPFISMGATAVAATLIRVAGPSPSAMGVYYTGAQLASDYSGSSIPFVAYPLGATNQVATTGSQSGAEGSIPYSTNPLVNPATFLPSPVVANFYKGGCHVYDTVNTTAYPVPTAGTFINPGWIEVFGPSHVFQGDVVVTNGLQLLLYQLGQDAAPRVYLWNTSLGTPAWQSIGAIKYVDGSSNVGLVRSIDFDRISAEEVRIRIRAGTSAGQWMMLREKLWRGAYHTSLESWPLTQNSTSVLNLEWIMDVAQGNAFNAGSSVFVTTTGTFMSVAPDYGYAAFQGTATASPIGGFLYQLKPTNQGYYGTTTQFGLGDSTGGAVKGAFKTYGFFVVPTTGAPTIATSKALAQGIWQQFMYDRVTSLARG